MSLESHVYILFWFNWLVVGVLSAQSAIPITKPNCKQSCENSSIKIPYPFGIGPNCYYNPWYEIFCNASSNSSIVYKPFLRKLDIEVLNISSCFINKPYYGCSPSELTLEVAGQWQRVCTSDIGISSQQVNSIDLKGTPFVISEENVVVATLEQGCSGYVELLNRSNSIIRGCSSTCSKSNTTTRKNNTICDGVNCCSISLPSASSPSIWRSDFYSMRLTDVDAKTCMKVAIMESSTIDGNIVVDQISSSNLVRTVLQWEAPTITKVSSELIRNDSCNPPFSCDLGLCVPGCGHYFQDLICQIDCFNYGCVSACTCAGGYEGNPYLSDGCQDIKDSCHGAARHSLRCMIKHASILGLSISLGSVIMLLISYGLYCIIRRQWRIRQRSKFFKRNGGLLLQQQISSTEGIVEKGKVYTVDELDKATDSFNANRILGQGGQGTVYKGMLSDGRIVAVKKSKKVDESQIEQFINEVVILSQISHRNVVKLLGCCLETEVPLLVYEFIQNGVLSKHIHDPSEDFHITWKMRLQIAAESAGAIAYLHSSSATPIYHRDIKSSNILLDEKYRAKVSDFGTSRTITIEQTHLTTCVQGTLGYLDPEYFQTNQYTEKSDVYSFGVVLIELLTSKKPLTPTRSGGWKSLAMDFLYHMENSSLFDILDTQVSQQATKEEIMAVANLGKRCLNLNGKRRPSMKAVAMALERITSTAPTEIVSKVHEIENNLLMEMSMIQIDFGSPITSFSRNDNNGGASGSVETQPLVQNSF